MSESEIPERVRDALRESELVRLSSVALAPRELDKTGVVVSPNGAVGWETWQDLRARIISALEAEGIEYSAEPNHQFVEVIE